MTDRLIVFNASLPAAFGDPRGLRRLTAVAQASAVAAFAELTRDGDLRSSVFFVSGTGHVTAAVAR